jgi:hypothetical protein
MDPSDHYYKTKRNLLLFVACLLLAIFAGFKFAETDQKITVLPFQLARPEFLTTILFIAVVFNLFQFSLHWTAQRAEVQRNRFHRIDFVSTTAIGALSLICYFWWLASDYLNITFERKISLGDIAASALAILFSLTAAVLSSRMVERWSQRIGRLLKRKAASDEERLSEKLKSSNWTLIFNPQLAGASKKITFEGDGKIGSGRNNNENTWRVANGLLEILNDKGQIFSRFSYDTDANEFLHTNDEDTLSIRSQKIVPSK